jgi:hypothetical protein
MKIQDLLTLGVWFSPLVYNIPILACASPPKLKSVCTGVHT